MKDLIKTFGGTKVLIIGDLMLDAYWYGRVDRISPEAPVPVVNIGNKEHRLGGAGNVALNIKPFEADPILCSVIGIDDHAEVMLEQMQINGLSTLGIVQSKYRPSTVKTRIWSKNQQLIRLDKESKDDLNKQEESELLERITELMELNPIEVIVFQDYNKGVLTASLIARVLKLAREKKVPTVVDPKERNFWAYKSATLFKPNFSEIKLQLTGTGSEALDEMADQVFSKLENDQLLITLSDKGIYYNNRNEKGVIPAKVRNIADVCGAGDTVVSIAALGIAKGWALQDIAILSNLAGGLVCEHVGVVPIDPERLSHEYLTLVKGH